MTTTESVSSPGEQQPPETVYHYTTLETMMKIVDSRMLWATSIRYLNDFREREGFMESAIERMFYLKQAEPDRFMNAFDDYLNHDPKLWSTSDSLPYTASFSERADSLPQWRSYCPYGAGVSIGFDTRALSGSRVYGDDRPPGLRTRWEMKFNVTFKKVRYAKFPFSYVIRNEVVATFQSALDDPDRLSKDERYPDIPLSQVFRIKIEQLAATYKDESFAAEEEYRLLADFPFWSHEAVGFRPARSSLIPYVKVEIPNGQLKFDRGEPWTAIKEIIVGPTPNPELTAEAVGNFMFSRGLKVPVQNTSVPYREW